LVLKQALEKAVKCPLFPLNLRLLFQNFSFGTASISKIRRIIMLEEKIKTALETVRPSLQADGGDVEFVSVDNDGTVSLKLTGACGGCPMAQMTLKMGIENFLKKEIPEVSAVVGV
jgi:Fe-S cluster biogenesis protein NfuA